MIKYDLQLFEAGRLVNVIKDLSVEDAIRLEQTISRTFCYIKIKRIKRSK